MLRKLMTTSTNFFLISRFKHSHIIYNTLTKSLNCMENFSYWESKFQPCQYSNKLLNLINELNKAANVPVDIFEVKKELAM